MPSESLVFDVKRYAINDGPGIRVVIFFKGCNLHCAWCHNPESISPRSELMFTPAKCIRCSTCVSVCREEAITLGKQGISIDYDRCSSCGQCADVCPSMALEMSGKTMTTQDILSVIEKERPFFDHSGGGVTFSGGEPLLHPKILNYLLDECGERGIHRVVDTAGYVRTEVLLDAARRTDLFLYDLKLMNAAEHQRWVGVGNELILHNLQVLSETGATIIIRIPLIVGINDDEDNIRRTAQFICGLRGERKEVHLLPYHTIARHKFEKLGRKEAFIALEEPDQDSLKRVAGWFEEYGIKTQSGG